MSYPITNFTSVPYSFKQLKISILLVFVLNVSKIIHFGQGTVSTFCQCQICFTSFSYSLLNVNDNKTKHFLMTRICTDKYGISLYWFLMNKIFRQLYSFRSRTEKKPVLVALWKCVGNNKVATLKLLWTNWHKITLLSSRALLKRF